MTTQQNTDLLANFTADAALKQAREILQGPLRQFRPAEDLQHNFKQLACTAYDLAAADGRHDVCAAAAGLLVDFTRRFEELEQKERWEISQAIHSTLTYPAPKFSSTFDIIISSTVAVMLYYQDGEAAPLVEFYRQVGDLIVQYIGDQAVDELVKFLSIPHDPHSVTATLTYLALLGRRGMDMTPALAWVKQLAQDASGEQQAFFVLAALMVS